MEKISHNCDTKENYIQKLKYIHSSISIINKNLQFNIYYLDYIQLITSSK